MKISDLFLKCLESEGIKTIYGVPGEENADLMISLLDSPIEFITCRHEQEAAFMADMQGRLTGEPGVCLATLGPGATNLATGLVNAQLDKVPVIGIIGQAETTRLHKESHQNMKAVEMYKPVTKWSVSISEAEITPEVIRKAVKLAKSSKPGAVVIELPEDIAKEDSKAQPIIRKHPGLLGDVDSAHISSAVALILESKKPLLLIGSGASYYNCDDHIKRFVDKTGMYGTCTFMGKGALSDDDDHSLHTVGLGMKDIALKAFDQADLVITVGYDMIEWHPDRWNDANDKQIIHIDTQPAEVDMHYQANLELIGDLNNILDQLCKAIPGDFKLADNYFEKIREAIIKDLARETASDEFPVKPQRIVHELRQALGEHDIAISDVGAHKMWMARQYDTYHSKTCFIYNGFASMGGSMPAAFVAKKLNPDKNVVAVIGDGGFVMSIQAIATGVRFKVPFVVLLWEDDHYGLIKWKQEATYSKHSHIDLHNEDLAAVASAFGCHSIKVNKTEELAGALQTAFSNKDKPTVIVVPVDYSENMKLTKHLGDIGNR